MSVVSFKEDGRISGKQRELLREFCANLGGDPVRLANRLGLKVFREKLPDDEDGGLVYDPALGSESGFVVLVNARKPLSRQKFTVAHEIGHFVLHRNEQEFLDVHKATPRILRSHRTDNVVQLPIARRSNAAVDRRNDGFCVNHMSERLEREADSFAVALLMPAYLIRRTPEFMNGEPQALARRLELSSSSVLRRFDELEFESSF